MSKKINLTPLANTTCRECPQRKVKGLQQVTTEYHGTEIDVMFIAESPGQTENSQGRPFVGRSGRIVRRAVLQLNNATQQGVAYANVVRCRPTYMKNTGLVDRAPSSSEIFACRSNVLTDIERLNPKLIVLCGDTAVKALATNLDGTAISTKQKILAIRGLDFLVKTPSGKTYPAIATYHFSYVLRTPNSTSVFRDDVAKALRRAQGVFPDDSKRGTVKVLTTVKAVKRFLQHLLTGLTKQDVVTFDFENQGLQRLNNPVLCMSFAYNADKAYVIPYAHPESPFDATAQQKVKKLLRNFFATKDPSFGCLVAHNAKFECLTVMDQFNTHVMMPLQDTMQRAHVLNEDRKGSLPAPYGLKQLVEECLSFYHYLDPDIAAVVAKRNEGKLDEVPLSPLAEYNGMDAYVTWRLFHWQRRWADAEGMADQFNAVASKLQGKVAMFLAEMEHNGIKVNKRQVVELASPTSELVARQNGILDEMYALPSVEQANKILLERKGMPSTGIWGGAAKADKIRMFDIRESVSKRVLFFDVLNLQMVKKSRKTGVASIDKSFFERHAGVPEIDLYAEYMQLDKIRTTYIESIHKFLQTDPDMRDQRIRPHFKPTGTITGRLSSANPNMLNIPARSQDEASKAIKRLYVVDPGNVLVCADYSQAEVRWLAEITQDPDLIAAFISAYAAKQACRINPTPELMERSRLHGDFHRHTASMVNDVSLDKVTKDQRTRVKALVFGIVYGMTAQGLAQRLKCTTKEAEAFMAKFFARFPKAQTWLDNIELEGYQEGAVFSPVGRRKIVTSRLLLGNEDVNALSEHLRYLKSHKNHEMRVCRNAPIQGVASDTNLLACCTLLDYILANDLNWRIVNTVYDSIMIEVPFPDAERCITTAQSIMEDPKLFSPFGITPTVPFAADFSVGVSWGDQLEVKYDEQAWEVKCSTCGKKRKEDTRPKNRRCEECGSKKVKISIVDGPLDLVLQQIDRDHNMSEFWT